MKIHPDTATDFYKTGHRFQYPDNTSLVYSNFTPRSDKLAAVLPDFDHKVVFYGLQGVIRWLLIDCWNEQFFNVPRHKAVARYKRRMDNALGVGAVSVDHIEALHTLGYLPLHIKALPEGSRVNMRVPLWTIKNTHVDYGWLTNYVETQLSSETWKTMTNATTAFEYRRLLDQYALMTGSPLDFVPWQGHDFSARGMSGIHDAAQSGGAHLLSFFGTDTISAIDYLEDYYYGENTFIGGSVPATEHSVMCLGGEENEYDTIYRLITEVYPSGIVSIVSDTWDFWNTICVTALKLKDAILARKPDSMGNAKTVFRPDSGDPVKIVCGIEIPTVKSVAEAEFILEDRASDEAGDLTAGECGSDTYSGIFRIDGECFKVSIHPEWNRHDKTFYYIDGYGESSVIPYTLSNEEKGAVECLWDIFGGTISPTGHKILDSHVGLIYGDSITLDRAQRILEALRKKGFASCNIVFGIGSFTYQHVTRDSFGSAIKATFGIVNGLPRSVSKSPKTDDGLKKSAKGLLRVEYENGNFVLYDEQTFEQELQGALRTVLLNGVAHNEQTIEEIRSILHNKQ